MMPGFKKAFWAILLVMLVAVTFCAEINAATEQDISDFLRAPFVVNGRTEYLHESFVVRAERFFRTHKFTPEEYEQILARLKEVMAIMQEERMDDPTSMSWQAEHRVLSLIYESAEVAGIDVEFGNNGLKFYEMDGTLIDEIYYTENAFKVTGLGDGIMLIAGLVLTFTGLALWICSRRRAAFSEVPSGL